MNWHRIITVGVGVIVAGLSLLKAGHSFVELNTPDAGIVTVAGFEKILVPAVLGLLAGWGCAWVAHILLSIGLPGSGGSRIPSGVTPDSPVNSLASLKTLSLSSLRDLASALAKAGRYDELAVVAKAEREIGGMFKP